MAITISHGPLHGSSGKVGNLVFRQHNGKTVVQLTPTPSEKPPTARQLNHRERFREAQHYAKVVLADSLQREVYRALGRERKRPPNTLLVADFLTPPTVDRIDDSSYSGLPGSQIKVLASDDIEVTSVVIAIRRADTQLVEEGPAVRLHGIWVYMATATAPAGIILLEVTATDRPGHTTKETKVRELSA